MEVKKLTVFSFVLSALGHPFKFDIQAETQEAALRDLIEKLSIMLKELQNEMNKLSSPKSS